MESTAAASYRQMSFGGPWALWSSPARPLATWPVCKWDGRGREGRVNKVVARAGQRGREWTAVLTTSIEGKGTFGDGPLLPPLAEALLGASIGTATGSGRELVLGLLALSLDDRSAAEERSAEEGRSAVEARRSTGDGRSTGEGSSAADGLSRPPPCAPRCSPRRMRASNDESSSSGSCSSSGGAGGRENGAAETTAGAVASGPDVGLGGAPAELTPWMGAAVAVAAEVARGATWGDAADGGAGETGEGRLSGKLEGSSAVASRAARSAARSRGGAPSVAPPSAACSTCASMEPTRSNVASASPRERSSRWQSSFLRESCGGGSRTVGGFTVGGFTVGGFTVGGFTVGGRPRPVCVWQAAFW